MKRHGVVTAVEAPADRLRTAVESDPSSLAFVALAHLGLGRGDHEGAIRICTEGLEYHPNHSTGRLVLGLALERAGREEEAQLAFRQVLETDPGNRIANQRLGEAFRRGATVPEPQAPPKPRPPPAEEEDAIDLGDEIAFFTISMAEVYEKQGFFERALSIYQRVLSLQPDRAEVRDRIRELKARMSAA